jgi:hypothetical protein
MSAMLAPLALAAALSLASPSSGAAPDAAPGAHGKAASVEAIVKKMVEAYGGKAAIARAAVRREEGTVTSLLHPGEVGRIVRALGRPGRLRVEVEFPTSREVRVLDGKRGWRDGEEATGPRLDAMVLQEARLDVVARLAAPGVSLTDAGTAMVKDVLVRVLVFEVAPRLTLEAQIDPATGRVLRTRGAAGGPMPVAFETTYEDFRKVDGVLVSFHETNWANGSTTGETVLRKVEFPRALPAGTFAP